MTRASAFRPFVQILFCLIMALVLVNVGLSLLAATPALAWLPKTVTGPGYLEDNRLRVAQALQEYQQGRISRADHLAAIVGISNVRQDIDLGLLADAAGAGWHVVGLGGAGLGMPDVARHADVLLNSALQPDVVVLGFDLHQLVDTRPKPAALETGFLHYVRQLDVRNAAIAVRASVWAYSRRQDVSIAVESAAFDARDWLFRRFHVHLVVADRRSPWRDMLKSDWPDHFSSATLREEEQFFEDLGVFDLRTYADARSAPATLVRLIEAFRWRRAEVLLVLMPEHSTLHRRTPPEALELLQSRLQAAFPTDRPVVLDFREAVDDSGFVDLAHLNRNGSASFSRLLAEKLRQYLPTHAALMSGSLSRIVR